MAKQELDYLNKLFVDHYRQLQNKSDISNLIFTPDKDKGTVSMAYDTATHIHISLRFDKKNCMYQFRSEKKYASMDQEKAMEFAKNVSDKYNGCRCNAYDGKMIIQMVGTYRDLTDKDAEELIHNHLNDFESFVITELEEFEEVCEIVDANEVSEDSAIEIPAEPAETTVEPEETDMDFNLYDVDMQNSAPKAAVSSDDTLDSMLSGLALDDTEQPEDVRSDGNDDLFDLSLDIDAFDDVSPTTSRQETVVDYLKELMESKQRILEEKETGKYSGMYFDESNIRFMFRYMPEEEPDVLQIQTSKKYDKTQIFGAKMKEIQLNIDRSASLVRGNILAVTAKLESPEVEEVKNKMKAMLSTMKQIDACILNNTKPAAVPDVQGSETIGIEVQKEMSENVQLSKFTYDEENVQFKTWEEMLKNREQLLEQQKQEVLNSIADLNIRTDNIVKKETEILQKENEWANTQANIKLKQQELTIREEKLAKQEEDVQRTLSVIAQREHTLAKNEADLKIRETSVKEDAEAVRLDKAINEKARKEIAEEKKRTEDYNRQILIKAGNISNQIRILEQQRDDLTSIIKMKTAQLQGGIAVAGYENELEDLRKQLTAKENEIQTLKITAEKLRKELADTVSKEKYRTLYNRAQEIISVCNNLKADNKNLEQQVSELKADNENIRRSAQRKAVIPAETGSDKKLRKELDEALLELDELKERLQDAENRAAGYVEGSTGHETGVMVTSDELKNYLISEHGATQEMIEELHAADGNIVKVDGDLKIMVCLKPGMSFAECFVEERTNYKVLKKVEAFNAKNGKSIVYTTGDKMYARTMFNSNSTLDEIYEIMKKTAEILDEL